MVGRRPGKTRPLVGPNTGEPQADSSARMDVPPPNGPGWRRDAPTTSAPKPLTQTAAQRSRDLKKVQAPIRDYFEHSSGTQANSSSPAACNRVLAAFSQAATLL